MTTPQQQPETTHWWNDQELFVRGLAQSNYVTACWDWFMMLLGKAAEPVLFASVLYSGYELLPGVPQPGAIMDAPVFVTQQAALDIGGMGLMKMAKHAHLAKDSFPYRVGVTLVVLMILNVALASLEKVVQMQPIVITIIEAVLLIARAVMAVLYGHAIHALKDEGVSLTYNRQVVQSQQVQHQVAELLNQFREELQGVQSQIYQGIQQVVQSEVQREVQVIHTEVQQAIEYLPKQVQDQVNHALRHRLNPPLEQRAEYHVPGSSGSGSVGSTPSGQEVQSTNAEPLHTVHSTPKVNPPGKQGERGAKVQRFITEQLAKGHTPTLKEIMDTCQCSKNTAIHHRRARISNGDEQEPGQPTFTIVRG
jgi:hypothetical protein